MSSWYGAIHTDDLQLDMVFWLRLPNSHYQLTGNKTQDKQTTSFSLEDQTFAVLW